MKTKKGKKIGLEKITIAKITLEGISKINGGSSDTTERFRKSESEHYNYCRNNGFGGTP